jgi:ferredoxin
MKVSTDSPRALHSQKLVLELLQSDMPPKAYRPDSELAFWFDKLKVGKPRFEPRHSPDADLSHPAIAVNLDACIQCTRCVRACRELQVNDVIGFAFRGHRSEIVFDLGDPMRAASASSRLTRPSIPSAPIAAWAVSSPITSRTIRSFASRAATALPITTGFASRAATGSTMSTTVSA